MAKLDLDFDVYMDDGTELRVHPDQRDFAAWEVQTFWGDERVQLRMRFTAWSALRRRGDYKQPFERFNNVDCIEVSVHRGEDDEDSEGEQGLDPGQQTPTATS